MNLLAIEPYPEVLKCCPTYMAAGHSRRTVISRQRIEISCLKSGLHADPD